MSAVPTVYQRLKIFDIYFRTMGNFFSQHEILPSEPPTVSRELSETAICQIRKASRIIASELLSAINFKYIDFYYWMEPEVCYSTSAANEGLTVHLD